MQRKTSKQEEILLQETQRHCCQHQSNGTGRARRTLIYARTNSFLIRDSAAPTAVSQRISIGINEVMVLEVSQQTLRLPVTIHYHGNHTELMLIDSGARGNFIDHDVVKEYSMTPQTLEKPIKVKNIDGTYNANGQITQYIRLNLTVNQQHFHI